MRVWQILLLLPRSWRGIFGVSHGQKISGVAESSLLGGFSFDPDEMNSGFSHPQISSSNHSGLKTRPEKC